MFWLGTALLSLFWGGSYLAIRFVVEEIPPYGGAAARLILASLCGLALLMFGKRSGSGSTGSAGGTGGPDWRLRGWALLVGVLSFGIPWAILFWAERYVLPSMGALSACSVPIFTRLLSPWVNPGDSHPPGEWIGIVIGFLGVIFLVLPGWQSPDRSQMVASLLLLLMALGYATGILGARRLSSRLSTPESLFYQTTGGLLLLFPLALLFEPFHPLSWGVKTWGALVYLGFFSTFVAFLIFLSMIKKYGSAQAAVVPYFPPVVSLLLDRWILKVLPDPLSIVGGLVILTGVYLTQRYKREA